MLVNKGSCNIKDCIKSNIYNWQSINYYTPKPARSTAKQRKRWLWSERSPNKVANTIKIIRPTKHRSTPSADIPSKPPPNNPTSKHHCPITTTLSPATMV